MIVIVMLLFPIVDQIRQQMMQNPEMLQQALDNPLVQSITSNPEMMQSIMMQNPMMQQLVEVGYSFCFWRKKNMKKIRVCERITILVWNLDLTNSFL